MAQPPQLREDKRKTPGLQRRGRPEELCPPHLGQRSSPRQCEGPRHWFPPSPPTVGTRGPE